MAKAAKFFGLGLILIAAVAAVVIAFGHRPPPPVAIAPATQPVIIPKPASKPATTRSLTYLETMRTVDVRLTADHFLDSPVSLDEAARLRLSGPIYLDPTGHIWITRSSAAPAAQMLLHWIDTGPTILRETPVFVHWSNDAGGNFAPCVVCRSGDGFDFISSKTVRHWAGPADCDWSRSFSFGEDIVIPTPAGVIVLDLSLDKLVAYSMTLPGLTAGANAPVAVLDSRGVLAWSPWEQNKPGSSGAMRFVDGAWSPVEAGMHLVQMVPLLDGSVLTIRRDEGDKVSLAIDPLEATDLDRKHLADLITKLSDDDADVRDSAYAELSRYGPGLWPILEQSLEDQPPEAKQRIQRLLRGKIAPALGGMSLIDNRLATVHRQPDGTVIFFSEGGIELPGTGGEPIRVTPAWIVLRPGGRFGRPLPADLVADQTPDHFTLSSVTDDWYTCDAAGPRRYLGGKWVPLLHPDESAFDRMVGQDAQGRWLFGQSNDANRYLLLDPTLLDPTPRLPVWSIKIEGTTGMDKDGWPTITRNKSTWALHEGGWAVSDEAPAPAPATAQPSKPTDPILTCPDGTNYFDGQTQLIIERPHPPKLIWPLPGSAQGSTPAQLIRTADGTLFLFNAPGRVLRIKPTAGPQPFTLDATFTRDIPNIEKYDRIWLDPAGRIAAAFNGNELIVMFPSGHMPEELEHMRVNQQP